MLGTQSPSLIHVCKQSHQKKLHKETLNISLIVVYQHMIIDN